MFFELHLSVSEMNLLIPAIENYVSVIQTSKVPAIKSNSKSKIEKLQKTSEKLKLLVSYAKTSTQAEKTRKQAEAKKQKYNALVFGSIRNSSVDSLLSSDSLEEVLSIDN